MISRLQRGANGSDAEVESGESTGRQPCDSIDNYSQAGNVIATHYRDGSNSALRRCAWRPSPSPSLQSFVRSLGTRVRADLHELPKPGQIYS
jgi:hypothetical protein